MTLLSDHNTLNMCELAFAKFPHSDEKNVQSLVWETVDSDVWVQLGCYFDCFYDDDEYSLYTIHKREILRLLIVTLSCHGIMDFFVKPGQPSESKSSDHMIPKSEDHDPEPNHNSEPNLCTESNLVPASQPDSMLSHSHSHNHSHSHSHIHIPIPEPLIEIQPTEAEKHYAIIHLLDVLADLRVRYCQLCESMTNPSTYCYHSDQIGFNDYYTIRCPTCQHSDHREVYELIHEVNLFRPNPFLIYHGSEREIRNHLLNKVLVGPGLDSDDEDDSDSDSEIEDEGDEDDDKSLENCRFVSLDTYIKLLKNAPYKEDVWVILRINK